MQLLELPAEVFRLIISCTVLELGLKKAMRLRTTCRTFTAEILEAVITTRVIEEVDMSDGRKQHNTATRLDLIERYLHHRVCTDGPDTHPYIVAIRNTSRRLSKLTRPDGDPAELERLERSACACLAAQHGSDAWEIAGHSKTRLMRSPERAEGGMDGSCLTLAAWTGNMDLVKSLYADSDPLTMFGRPSWAAAAQGHCDVLQFCLDRGAVPYEPDAKPGPALKLRETPLGAAAYMGHENIVRFLLQHEFYQSFSSLFAGVTAASFAGQGDQVNTLKLILDHVQSIARPLYIQGTADSALLGSCDRGALHTAKLALDYGADPNETDPRPRSCLQLAARSGNALIVKMLLDAGADIPPARGHRQRMVGLRGGAWGNQLSAMSEAKRRGYTMIVQLIEEKQRIIDAENIELFNELKNRKHRIDNDLGLWSKQII